MTHVRQSIRDNVVTATTGLSTTGSNVFRTRVYPLESGNLPGLCVYANAEVSEVDTLASTRGLERTVDIVVDAYVRAIANYDTSLDTICGEVEAALATGVTRGGNAKETNLVSTDIEYSDDGDRPIGMARMTFAVVYRTAINDATTAL